MKYFYTILMFFITACGCGEVCKNVDCGTNGTCYFGDCDTKDSCACLKGYQMDYHRKCDSVSREKFIGTYQVADTCQNGYTQDTIRIVVDSSAIDKVIIQHFGGYETDSSFLSITANVTQNTLIIPEQWVFFQQHEYHISQTSANFKQNGFILQYQVYIDGTLDTSCIAHYHK